MQIQQLRYAVAVADLRHFTRAAAHLHVAQPSLSAQVRALERDLGAPLFERVRGRVGLTPAGEAFLPWARQALADLEAGREHVRDLLGVRGGRLALGATPSLTAGLLPRVVASFHDRYPGVRLALRETGSRDLVADLAAGALDLAMIILPVVDERIATVALADEELVLAVPRDHPLAECRRIRTGALRDLPLVLFREGYDLRTATVSACRAAGFEPTVSIEGGEMSGALAFARAGLGAVVVPTTAVPAGGDLVAVRFEDGSLTRTVGLAERAGRLRPPAVAAFVAALTDQLRTHGWPGGPHAGLVVHPAGASAAVASTEAG